MMKNLMLVAAAAMGFTACQSGLDEITMRPTEPEKVTISIVASEAEESRTAINEDAQSFVWSEGDQIKVIENSTAVDSDAAEIDENGLATFTASFTADEGTFTYNALYPNTAYNNVNLTDDEYQILTITPAIQNATATSFDPKADLLLAKPIEATQTEATPLNMQFKRLVAIGKMTFKNLPADATIDAVTFTATGKVLAGRSRFACATGQVVEYGYNSPMDNITINYAEAIAADNAVFFTCLPCEIVAEETFTVSAVCGDKTYTHTVTMPEGRSLLFTEGDLTTFSVDMADATVKDSFSIATGDYVIMVEYTKDGSTLRNMMKASTGTYQGYTAYTGEMPVESITTSTDNIWTITNNGDTYTIMSKSEQKYLSWTSGNTAQLVSDAKAMNIVASGEYANIIVADDTTRKLQYNSGSPRFAFYTSTQNPNLLIIPVKEKPSISVDATSHLFSYISGDDFYFEITANNFNEGDTVDDITITVEEGADEWLICEYEGDGALLTNVTDNTSTTSRSATITLSYEGAEDVVITITQEGAPSATTTTYTYDMTVVSPSYGTTISGYNNYTGAKAYWYANETSTFDADTELALVFGQGSANYAPNWNSNYNNTTINVGNTLTIEGKTISMIEFTFASSSTGVLEADCGSFADGVWTGSSNKIVFTGTTKSTYITKIVVTYDTATKAEFTPAIVAVEPEAITFEANTTETSQTITATVMSYRGDITATGLESAKYTVATNGNKVTVTALDTAVADTSTLVLGVEGGNTWNVPVVIKAASTGDVTLLTDILNNAFIGISGTTYKEWSGKSGSASSAVYAGQSAGGNSSIQLRSSNSNSGIVTTTSGGKVRKVVVTWNSNTSNGRTLNIYGSNTAYTSPTELYNTSTAGTKLGTIVCGTSTELEITGDYAYIGLRSNGSAMYLDEIQISWEN